MHKTRKWRITPLAGGKFLARHPNCPPKPHVCWRGLISGNLCGVRETLPQAYRLAAARFSYEVHEEHRIREELAPPPGWTSNAGRAPW